MSRLRFKRADGLDFGDSISLCLGDVAEYRKSRRVAQEVVYVSTEDLLKDIEGISKRELTEAEGVEFFKGDILLGNIRPYLKKIWLADCQGVCSADVLVIRSKSIYPSYLFYMLSSEDFFRHIADGYKGSKMPRGDKKQIMEYQLNIPEEIKEQQKIAAFFTALDEKIQNTCKKLVLTLKMKRALVRDILTREVGFSSSSDWQDVKLGDVSSIIKTRKSSEFLLYVGTEDLIKDFGGLNKVKKEDVSGIYFERDDILISNIRPYLKKLWMSDEEGIASTDVIVYRSKNIEPSLLKHILSTDSFFEHVAQGYKGSKMPRGDKSQMATFAFQIPSDEKEQKQIANFLNLIDKKITCLREQEKALKKQKQAFMQQMFV